MPISLRFWVYGAVLEKIGEGRDGGVEIDADGLVSDQLEHSGLGEEGEGAVEDGAGVGELDGVGCTM